MAASSSSSLSLREKLQQRVQLAKESGFGGTPGRVEGKQNESVANDKTSPTPPSPKELPLVVAALPKNPDLIPLQSKWTLYHHDRNSRDWTLKSYHVKASFDNIGSFWRLYNNFRGISEEMLFLMRQGYPPLWEDPKNINGGALSFRIHKRQADNFWLMASMLLIGESLLGMTGPCEEFVGLSISPKGMNQTFRLWFRNGTVLPTLTPMISRELLDMSDSYIVKYHRDELAA